MNGFNRTVMLLLSLLLIAVPVFLLLVGYGVIPADLVNAYTGYRSWVPAIGEVFAQDLDARLRAIVGTAGLLLAILSLILLLRELTFGRPVAKKAIVDQTPRRETAVSPKAIKSLAGGAVREAGAVPTDCSLSSKKGAYIVSCGILVPDSENFAELAGRVKESVRRILESQNIPLREVEVIIEGTTSEREIAPEQRVTQS